MDIHMHMDTHAWEINFLALVDPISNSSNCSPSHNNGMEDKVSLWGACVTYQSSFFIFLFLFKKKIQAHHSIFFSPANLYHNCPTLTSYLVMKRIINLCNKELNWKVFICDLLPYIYIYIYSDFAWLTWKEYYLGKS